MFGLPSIQKLIVLGLVIAAVWYGFKFLGRLQAARKAEAKLRAAEGKKPQKRKAEPPTAGTDKVADLVPCPSCGAYVQADSRCSCGHKL
ncbi:hypothetical protein HBA54_16555 [Pelagibius litoralis]|uniref:Uncharacterized protein n=1 Tax=Pelagibius litoralis TaxID=374515 RepID=A0A967EZG0_9PROT|nr:hypothetical protein [Pelagibius litoralis]NIA70219.1 hypothetical protein [Pelagibius litoralis]